MYTVLFNSMRATGPRVFDVLLVVGAVAAFAHGAVALVLSGHRREWRERGKLFFWDWQTWDASNYSEEGKRLYIWLPITFAVLVASALLAVLVLLLGT
jgi:hypothetical protein